MDRRDHLSIARRPGKTKAAILPVAGLGRRVLAFDEDEVVRLLRAAVEDEGGQKAFARRHGLDRSYVNMVLNGKGRLRDALIKALELRRVYAAK